MKKLLTVLLSLLIGSATYATDSGWIDIHCHDEQGRIVYEEIDYRLLYEAFNLQDHSRHYWVEYRDGNDPDWDNYHKPITDYYLVKDDYYSLKDYSKGEDYHKDAIVDYSILTKFLNKTFPGCNASMRKYRETHDGVNYYVTELRFLNSWYDSSNKYYWVSTARLCIR